MNTLQSLFQEHKKVIMTKEEKERVWKTIETRTFNSPVRNSIPSRLYSIGGLSTPKESVFSKRKKYALTLFVGSAVLCGGVSAYAQSALPGDILYPVKTQVVEKIKIAAALTPEAKASVAAHLAHERLLEVERLIAQGTLTAETQTKSAQSFEEHVSRLENELHILQINNQQEALRVISTNFYTKAVVHATVLKTLTVTTPNYLLATSTQSLENTVVSRALQVLEIENAAQKGHASTTAHTLSSIDTSTADTYIQTLRDVIGISSDVEISITASTSLHKDTLKTSVTNIIPSIIAPVSNPSPQHSITPTQSTSSIDTQVHSTTSVTSSAEGNTSANILVNTSVEKITETLPVSIPTVLDVVPTSGLLP